MLSPRELINLQVRGVCVIDASLCSLVGGHRTSVVVMRRGPRSRGDLRRHPRAFGDSNLMHSSGPRSHREPTMHVVGVKTAKKWGTRSQLLS